MIDNKFDKTERFLNIENSDIFFVKEGDKAVACKFTEFEFHWPSFNGRMMLSKLGIVTAEGKRYNKDYVSQNSDAIGNQIRVWQYALLRHPY